MSLPVAVPCAVLSALAYGSATAVQHAAAHDGTGRADARGLVRLLRDPRWLMSIGGDAVGLALQVVALSTGPVVLVQPLLVLAVPVSLPVGWMLGGRRPVVGDYLACAAIVAALAVFFVVLGDPGTGEPLSVRDAVGAVGILFAVGTLAWVSARGRSARVRAAVYGGVAGASFGLVGVLLDATATTWQAFGWDGFLVAAGWVPLLVLGAVGVFALTLTQVSFQVGALGASFPANEAAAPVVAVALGGVLLHERVPTSPVALLVYAGCLAGIVAGTIWLARAWSSGTSARPAP